LLKLTAVRDTLRGYDLLVKGSKTDLFRKEVEFLGLKISAAGWAPMESKMAALVEWPAPETVKHPRSVLSIANFFRSFIPTFSEMAARFAQGIKARYPSVGMVSGL